MDQFKNILLKYTDAFQSNKYVKAITSAMMGLIPIMMISSVVSLINNIGIAPFQSFIASTGIKDLLGMVNDMTINIVSIYVAYLIGHKLGELYKKDALYCGIMSLMAFLLLTPLSKMEGFTGFSIKNFGSAAMFTAIIGGLIGARIYIFFLDKNWTIKLPDQVPPQISKSFAAIIPGVMVAILVGIMTLALSKTSYGTLNGVIFTLIQAPLASLGANIFTAMFIVAFIELLWFFGIHGVLAIYPVLMLLFQEQELANLAAYGAGESLPYLFTMGFVLGNRGARSFAVCLLALFRSKSLRLKTVGKIGVVPAAFGISEPVKFGIPQIMNLRMLIPLMLTPAVSVFIAWTLTVVGFLPYHNGVNIPLGFPIVAGAFFQYGWQGIVSQLLQLAACVIIYIPFMKSQDKEALLEEHAANALEEENKKAVGSQKLAEVGA